VSRCVPSRSARIDTVPWLPRRRDIAVLQKGVKEEL
jgi:hypothetical protein